MNQLDQLTLDQLTAVRKAQRILTAVRETDTGTGDYLETEAGYVLQALNAAFGKLTEEEEEE